MNKLNKPFLWKEWSNFEVKFEKHICDMVEIGTRKI